MGINISVMNLTLNIFYCDYRKSSYLNRFMWVHTEVVVTWLRNGKGNFNFPVVRYKAVIYDHIKIL